MRASFSFSGLLPSQLDPQDQPMVGAGYDLADFLLGDPKSTSLRFGAANNYLRGWVTSWSAQDDWRPRAELTIMVGLCFEYFDAE